MMASTDTSEGAQTTLDALDYGALDFIHKPDNASDCRVNIFQKRLLGILELVVNSNLTNLDSVQKQEESLAEVKQAVEFYNLEKYFPKIKQWYNGYKFEEVFLTLCLEYEIKGVLITMSYLDIKEGESKIVAIASSTGGPKALQAVIPRLPADLKAPVLIVQHMPKGFTASLAERLDALSQLSVVEASEGDVLEVGKVYIARGGMHMNVITRADGQCEIHYSDEPAREGVKPCANYMYESLLNSDFDEITCVVMTGMGCDATAGIKNLATSKQLHVIAQDEASSVVYGMPKSIVNAGLSNQVVPLEQIAREIILNVGVK